MTLEGGPTKKHLLSQLLSLGGKIGFSRTSGVRTYAILYELKSLLAATHNPHFIATYQ